MAVLKPRKTLNLPTRAPGFRGIRRGDVQLGAWGNRIMESDLASDIRGVFCRQIEVGGTVSKAVNKVYEELGHSEHDPDFFLALAWVIASMGAVPIDIRERALRIIADSGSLERWRDSGFFRERQKEEQRLRQILEGTVPHPEPYKKATVARIKVGDVLEIPLTSGKRAYAQYLCADPKHGSLIQVFALTGDQVPELRDIIDSGPLFPPIFSDVKVAAKH